MQLSFVLGRQEILVLHQTIVFVCMKVRFGGKFFQTKNIVMLVTQGLTSSFLSCPVSSVIMDSGGG